MGILDKEAYWGKMMYAEERNAKSREKGAENGLTDEQADALESMARARHNMHTNIDSLVSSSENRDCERDLIRANAKLREAGLPTVSSIPLDEDDYINIDSFDIIMYDTDIAKEEYGMPDKYENEEAWQEWYDRMYGRLYDKWEAINDKIENYLGEIDEKYGTSYRPTGATRFSIVQETKETDISFSLTDDFVNEQFNEQLVKLTEKNANSTMFRLGYPSVVLQSAGIPNKELRLYGNKLLKKAERHGFDVKDLVNLPTSMQMPMFVFKGNHSDSFSIIAELKIKDKNVLVAIERNKNGEVDFNLISSVYGKNGGGIVYWINNGKALYINKEKALAWQAALAPIASATLKQELISATKIIKDFHNPAIKEEKNNIQKQVLSGNELKESEKADEEKLEKLVSLLKKTGFADVKTGEDFYIKLSEITGDERYWINQRVYSDESRWDNSGYSERNDGSKASVNAISAEEDGTFSAGNFIKKYGVSKTNFEILTALKLIKNTEWHHTRKSFKETEFYSWADSTKADGKVEYDMNGQVVNDEDIDFTPLSEIYQEHKKELTKLAKEYTEKNWEYQRPKEEKEIPTFEEYAQKIGMENSPLTEEEEKKRRDSHWYISDNLVDELSSYERRIRHEEVDEHYQKIRQERADIYIEANRERLLEEYNATYKDDMAYNAEIKAYNKGVEESNSLSNGKEKVLLRIAEIFEMNEDKAKLNVKIYSRIKQAAIRHKAREEWVESQEKELNKTIVKKDNELQAWLQKQVKEGKVKYQSRITRYPDNFIETKKEKYGKYGWYDASKTIGGQEYYSGYEFESEKLYKEYRRRFRAIIDIKVKAKDKILEEANVRFMIDNNKKKYYGKEEIEQQALRELADELNVEGKFKNILYAMNRDFVAMDNYGLHSRDIFLNIAQEINEETKERFKNSIREDIERGRYAEYLPDNNAKNIEELKNELIDRIVFSPVDYRGAIDIRNDIRLEVEREKLINRNYNTNEKIQIMRDYMTFHRNNPYFERFLQKTKEITNNVRFNLPNGIVYGFVTGDTVYLNPEKQSLNTPIHEFGHLWVSQIKKYFPDLWEKGKELFLQSNYLRVVQEDPNYRHLDLDGQVDEAMARAIGDNGEKELNKTLFEKISNWISNVWKHIGSKFGIENLTSKQIQNLSLQDFTNIATSELLSGRNLTKRVNKQKEIETTTERYQIAYHGSPHSFDTFENNYQYIIEREALIRLAKELHKDDFESILCDMYEDLIPIYVCNEDSYDSYDYHRIDYRISSNIEEEIKKVIVKNIDDGKYEYEYNKFIDDYKKEYNKEYNESIDENYLKDLFADVIAANPYAYGVKHICDNIREKVLKEEVLSINYDIYTQADILQLYIKKLSPDFICKRLEELKNEVTIDVSEKILMKEFNLDRQIDIAMTKAIGAVEQYQINTEEKKEKPNKVECSIKCEIGDKLTKNYYNNRVVGSSEKLSAVDIFTFLQQTKEKGRAFLNNIVSEATGNRLDDVRLTTKNVVERIINPMTEKQQFAVKEAMVRYVEQKQERKQSRQKIRL